RVLVVALRGGGVVAGELRLGDPLQLQRHLVELRRPVRRGRRPDDAERRDCRQKRGEIPLATHPESPFCCPPDFTYSVAPRDDGCQPVVTRSAAETAA